MSILITGSAGFFSFNLALRLLERGDEFIGANDNAAHLLDNPNLELMRHGLTFPRYAEVDEIYNGEQPGEG